MKQISNLGPLFFAFLSGGVFGVSANVMTSTFLGEALPKLWWLLVGSCVAHLIAAVLLCLVSIMVAKIEAAQAALPLSLSKAEWERGIDEIVQSDRSRIYLFVACSIVLFVAGIALIPVRLLSLSGYL